MKQIEVPLAEGICLPLMEYKFRAIVFNQ